jgi:hypothetical protein
VSPQERTRYISPYLRQLLQYEYPNYTLRDDMRRVCKHSWHKKDSTMKQCQSCGLLRLTKFGEKLERLTLVREGGGFIMDVLEKRKRW